MADLFLNNPIDPNRNLGASSNVHKGNHGDFGDFGQIFDEFKGSVALGEHLETHLSEDKKVPSLKSEPLSSHRDIRLKIEPSTNSLNIDKKSDEAAIDILFPVIKQTLEKL